MQRPPLASQTRGPTPLVIASRAATVSRKGIPDGQAPREGWFWGSGGFTTPATRGVGLPCTERASNAFEGLALIDSRRSDHPVMYVGNGTAKPPFRRRLVGAHCFVTVHVPVRSGLSVPFACAAHVPVALLPSNVAARAISADSSGGKSYFAVILSPSNESALKIAL